MKRCFVFLAAVIFLCSAVTYADLYKDAKAAFDKGDLKTAIEKIFESARTDDGSKGSEVYELMEKVVRLATTYLSTNPEYREIILSKTNDLPGIPTTRIEGRPSLKQVIDVLRQVGGPLHSSMPSSSTSAFSSQAPTTLPTPLTAPSVAGPAMNVLYLDGTGAYVQLPPNIFDRLTNVTVEAWVKWERFNNWAHVFDFGREKNAILIQNEETSSTLHFTIYDRKEKGRRVKAEKVITAGTWYHIAAVCGYGGMALYVNGQFVDSDKYDGGLDEVAGGKNYVGRSNWPKDDLFQGYIAEFRVWDRRRSASEIASTMNRLLTGQEPGLVAYWRFNYAEGSNVQDSSPNGHTAALVGDARIVAVPAIARHLIPGELGKDAEELYQAGATALKKQDYAAAVEAFQKALTFVIGYKDAQVLAGQAQKLADEAAALKHYTEAQTRMTQGAYREAYDDFKAAVERVPGYKDASAKMQEALERGRYSVAVFPFTSQSSAGNADLLYETVLSSILNRLSPFARLVDSGTLQTLLSAQRGGLSVVDPEQMAQMARESSIRVAVVGKIVSATANYTRPQHTEQTAYTMFERTYVDENGKEKKKREKGYPITYYDVKNAVNVKCEVSYQIIDAATGQLLKSDMASAEGGDEVEYSEYNGQLSLDQLFHEDLGRPLSESRWFKMRKDLKDGSILLSETTRGLGTTVADRLGAFLDTYAPKPMPATSGLKVGKTVVSEGQGSSARQRTAARNTISTSQATKPVPSGPGETGYRKVITLSGESTKDTESFTLSAGKVKMVARTWGGADEVGSWTSIELESEDRRFLSGADLVVETKGSEQGRNETIVRNVKAGRYYVSVKSGVSWEVTIYQQPE